jgi:hypothetical protein
VPLSFPHQETRNTVVPPFLSEIPKHGGYFFFVKVVYQIISGDIAVPIQTHIQRTFGLETKPPLGIIELKRGNAQVKEYAVDFFEMQVSQDIIDIHKVGIDQITGRFKIAQPVSSNRQRLLVSVNANQPSAGQNARDYLGGGSPEPYGCVDYRLAGFKIQVLSYLFNHYRRMKRCVQFNHFHLY